MLLLMWTPLNVSPADVSAALQKGRSWIKKREFFLIFLLLKEIKVSLLWKLLCDIRRLSSCLMSCCKFCHHLLGLVCPCQLHSNNKSLLICSLGFLQASCGKSGEESSEGNNGGKRANLDFCITSLILMLISLGRRTHFLCVGDAVTIDWPIYRTAVHASKFFAKQSPRNTELLPQVFWSWAGEGGWGHMSCLSCLGCFANTWS